MSTLMTAAAEYMAALAAKRAADVAALAATRVLHDAEDALARQIENAPTETGEAVLLPASGVVLRLVEDHWEAKPGRRVDVITLIPGAVA